VSEAPEGNWLTLEDAAEQLRLTKGGVSRRGYESRPAGDGTRRSQVRVPLADLQKGPQRLRKSTLSKRLSNVEQPYGRVVPIASGRFQTSLDDVRDQLSDLRNAVEHLGSRLSQIEQKLERLREGDALSLTALDRERQRQGVERLTPLLQQPLSETDRASLLRELISKLPDK
jgi:hypothetical protein